MNFLFHLPAPHAACGAWRQAQRIARAHARRCSSSIPSTAAAEGPSAPLQHLHEDSSKPQTQAHQQHQQHQHQQHHLNHLRHARKVSDPPRLQLNVPSFGPLSYTDPCSHLDSSHVVIALHGCPGSAFDWRYIGYHLEPHFRFIRLELPGHGRTPLSTCNSAHASDIVKLVHAARQLLVPQGKKVVVVGHSLGAQIALHYGATYPTQVQGLAVLASALNLRPHRGIRPWPFVGHAGRIAARHHVAGMVLRPLNKLVMTRVLGFAPRFTEDELFQGWQRVCTLDFNQHREICATLTHARVPVLATWTLDDPLIEGHVARETASALPRTGPRLEYDTGGHMMVKTRAEDLGRELEKWVRGL